MRSKTALSLLFGFLVAVTVACPASAAGPTEAGAPTNDAASAEKQRGDRAMDSLRFDEALDAYTHAYEIGRDPAVLYNRSRLHQARGDYTKALTDLETFEREASPALRAKVPKLAELLADIRAHVATLTIRCSVTGARVLVRSTNVGVVPLDPVRLNAGPARIEVTAPDHVPYASETTLAGGTTTVLDVSLVPREAPAGPVPSPRAEAHPEPAPKKSGITGEWWFWAGAGAIVVGAAVAIVVVAGSEKSPSNGDGFSPSRVSAPLVSW